MIETILTSVALILMPLISIAPPLLFLWMIGRHVAPSTLPRFVRIAIWIGCGMGLLNVWIGHGVPVLTRVAGPLAGLWPAT